jgi:hypothetical protein
VQPITAVKKLNISKEFVPPIISAAQELIDKRATKVLPDLANLSLKGVLPWGGDKVGHAVGG